MLKTNEEWQKICKIKVHDPDGWDRSPEGWQYSWYEELITKETFLMRTARSTCSFFCSMEALIIGDVWNEMQEL